MDGGKFLGISPDAPVFRPPMHPKFDKGPNLQPTVVSWQDIRVPTRMSITPGTIERFSHNLYGSPDVCSTRP